MLDEGAIPPQLQLSVSGDVTPDERAYALDKIDKLLAAVPDPVLHKSLRLEHAGDPAHERPCRAQVTLDLNGEPVRAHVAAHTMHEAVDLLEQRIRDRLEHRAEHRIALRRRGPRSPAGEWRHGDLVEPRGPYFPRPAEDREIFRQRAVSPPRATVDEAIFDLESMDHDFWLFTDSETDQDAVVHRGLRGTYSLHYARPSGTEPDPHYAAAVEIDPHGAPQHTESEAREHLDASSDPWLFYVDPVSARGHVLYRRYDGHYGLLTPADDESGSAATS